MKVGASLIHEWTKRHAVMAAPVGVNLQSTTFNYISTHRGRITFFAKYSHYIEQRGQVAELGNDTETDHQRSLKKKKKKHTTACYFPKRSLEVSGKVLQIAGDLRVSAEGVASSNHP